MRQHTQAEECNSRHEQERPSSSRKASVGKLNRQSAEKLRFGSEPAWERHSRSSRRALARIAAVTITITRVGGRSSLSAASDSNEALHRVSHCCELPPLPCNDRHYCSRLVAIRSQFSLPLSSHDFYFDLSNGSALLLVADQSSSASRGTSQAVLAEVCVAQQSSSYHTVAVTGSKY
jgi:hypothetical protein